ncbi:MAG: flagellar biosynthetic protein FliR [Armatimonadia bacterium]
MTLSLPHLLIFLAGCPRVMGLVAFAPGFSAGFVPPTVRVTLSLALAFALAPLIVPPGQDVLALTPEAYGGLLLSELALGAVIGFLLSTLLEAARLAGEIVDLQIGFRAGSMYDPATGGHSALLGQFWYLAALLFFFVINGHHWLMTGLMRSFELCPVGGLTFAPGLADVAVRVLSASFLLALQVAAPVVGALILADLTLGLVGRGMPQMNLMLVGMPAKITIGVAALALSSPMMATAFTRLFESFQHYLTVTLRMVAG